jgi:hypothetical protein
MRAGLVSQTPPLEGAEASYRMKGIEKHLAGDEIERKERMQGGI